MIDITSILDAERHLNGIEAVIFDLDDTLYAEKEYVRSGYRAIAAAFPQVECMEEKLWSEFMRGGKAIDEVFLAEGLTDYRAEAVQMYRFHQPDIHLYPGVMEMLLRIKQSAKAIGIITDGRPEGQRLKIEALHLRDVADKIIITDELGGVQFRKPNKAAFVMMHDFFQIHYRKMCYIGDNIEKDFVAPEMLNIKSIYFKNRDGLYGEEGKKL